MRGAGRWRQESVWRSAFSGLGDLRLRLVVGNSGSYVGQGGDAGVLGVSRSNWQLGGG
jgi:hypothetical protein